MNDILKLIGALPKKHCSGAIDKNVIDAAQDKLGIKFSLEYRCILENFGFLLVKGNEFLGISNTGKYDIVSATLESRKLDSGFPNNMYVISNIGIDGILLLQNESGSVYSYKPFSPLAKEASSLFDYLKNQ